MSNRNYNMGDGMIFLHDLDFKYEYIDLTLYDSKLHFV